MKIKAINYNINRNKKAIIRIIESFVAIMMVLAVVLLLISRQRTDAYRADEIVRLQKQVLDYVKVDDALRSQILSNNRTGVESLIDKTVPIWINHSVNVCDATQICSNPAGLISGQVYSNEILITANKTYYPGNATKLVLYFWEA